MSSRYDMEPDSTVYKTLLESTKAIPWRIDWKTLQFTYIGPQIEELLGWKPESWLTVNDWAERMHPDDRDNVVNFCISQSQSGIDHEADYRALTLDGGCVWIRDVVHVVRNNGEVEALVGFMFDITDRKRTEEELQRLQRELDAVSEHDRLTGIASRRLFASVLAREAEAQSRSGQPLSLVLLDLDAFSGYNAVHGRLVGDESLRRVARQLQGVVSRPRDLVARVGDDSFALLLPETDAAAAHDLAETCRRRLLELLLPHPQSPVAAYLTASVGVGTQMPAGDSGAATDALLNRVAAVLEDARRQGGNRVGA